VLPAPQGVTIQSNSPDGQITSIARRGWQLRPSTAEEAAAFSDEQVLRHLARLIKIDG